MSCIHFKFKSSIDYEKLTFDGLHISLCDLKEAIMKQKKIGSFNQYTLSVKDAQSKKEYTDDQEMIPRNTSVIISRVPVTNPTKLPKTQRKDHTLPQPESISMTTTSAPSSLPPPLTSHRQLTANELEETANLASANASEEDKVKAMMKQSSKDFDPSRYVSVAPMKGASVASLKRHPPPPTYSCHRCGKKGHWIQLCPTNGDPSFDNRNYKRSLGTPNSQIISATANMPGVMLDRHGNLVMKKVDYQAYIDAQRKTKPEAPAKLDLPDELMCPICKKLVKDAVIIQCCSESFCYECIQEYLCENEFTCPLCKATDVSPETLVPNKALRTAAKNFQLKESEQKSVSEARGYVPMVTPQHVVLSANNLTPVIANSASSSSLAGGAISNGPTGGVIDVPSKATPTKDKDTGTAKKSEETEPEVSEADTLTVKVEEEKPPEPVEKSASPTPQLPRVKNRSEALLDRILSKKQTPPPTAPSTSSAAVTTGASTSNIPAKPPPTVVVAPPTASLLGSVGVASGLATPNIAAAAATALLSGGGGSLLGLPRAAPPPSSCTLPGQGAVLTTSAVLPHPPPVVISEPGQSQEESAKLERIAAELLAAAVTKKSSSPPPLTAEEFYRQQKILKLFTKQSRRRTPSPYSGASNSRSSTPDSYFSHRSVSDSDSLSRSHSPSGSSYSSSRSRSRSPVASRHSHRSKKHRSRRHKHEKTRHEKSREKGKEKKSSHHHSSRKKRKRYLSPGESAGKYSKSHHRAVSPDRKKYKDDVTPSGLALAEGGILSPESSLPSGALTPEMEVDSQGKASSSSASHHRHHHKKRSKTKHSRRRPKESNEEMEVDLAGNYMGDCNLDEEPRPDGTADQKRWAESVEAAPLQIVDIRGGVELSENEGKVEELNSRKGKVTTEGDGLPAAEANSVITDGSGSTGGALVPYQDSSNTEAEGRDLEETHTAINSSGQERPAEANGHGAKERPSENNFSCAVGDQEVNEAIEQLEAVLKEGGADGEKIDGGGEEAVNEGAPPTPMEEEGGEAMEDSLMIAVHVEEDAIDQDSAELLDAECPNKAKTGKEDGEITTDSDKDNDDDDDDGDAGPLSSNNKATPLSSAPPRSSSQSTSSTVTSLKSPTSDSLAVFQQADAPPTLTKSAHYSDNEQLSNGQEKDGDVDLRVILNKQKTKKQQARKHFASTVTVLPGFMTSNQSQSSTVSDEWSGDKEMDSASSSESSSEVEKPRSLKVTNSKHSSFSLKRHKRKHSSSKSHRDKEKKRKRSAKEYSGSKKKKSRREEKEREREKAKKRKKPKKSEKYSTKYSH